MRIYRLQGIAVLIFVPITVSITLMQSVHDSLMLIGAGVVFTSFPMHHEQRYALPEMLDLNP